MIPATLDTANADQVGQYERAFHTAFQRARGNRLIRTLWCWDDDHGRLATRIPYDDQIVYWQADRQGDLAAALAVNLAMKDVQASAFGFAPLPEYDQGQRICELLTFFAVGDHRLVQRLHFIAACFSDLHRRGHAIAYATTAARILPVYCRYFGGTQLAATCINGEERFFLRFVLQPAYPRFMSDGGNGR